MQKLPDFLSYWIPQPLQISAHFTKKATDSALISWIFINFNTERTFKKSMIALVPPIGTKNRILGVLAHGLTA